ncbi:MAG TPA: undecaprenyl-diphosphatase [Bacillales bacterium]|nr:undecaprenyl-diphosphatase [Bacillales bacterium]
MNPFDRTLFHFVNQFAGHNPVVDAFMSFISEYSPEIYGALFIIAWFTLPRTDSLRRHSLVVGVCGGILALIINVIIAHIWFRPRPFVTLPKGDFTQLVPHANDASFPSDHTSGSFGFASATWGKAAKWVSYSFTILAVLVLISRVYCGEHWPTDVLASVVVGVFSGRIMWKLSRWIYPITELGLRIFSYGKFSKQRRKRGTNVSNDR